MNVKKGGKNQEEQLPIKILSDLLHIPEDTLILFFERYKQESLRDIS